MIKFEDIRLNRFQLQEVLECLPKNFLAQEKKIYYEGLSLLEKQLFDEEKFILEKLNKLYKNYPIIKISVDDKIYGYTNGRFQFISHEPCIYEATKQLFPELIKSKK